MNVEYSGYREDYGMFCFKIPINENRTDYVIQLKNGTVLHQNTPFESMTHDWNNDGDVYTMFGAFFRSDSPGGQFLTPEDMVWLVVEEGAKIQGIENPFRRPSLDEKIRQADKQSQSAPHRNSNQEKER